MVVGGAAGGIGGMPRRGGHRRRDRGRLVWIVLSVASLLAATSCSGSDDAEPLPTLPNGGDERPEGVWSVVSIELDRSDRADLEPGTAQVRRFRLRPQCQAGPCDLDVEPAGADGTAYPEGVTPPDGTDASADAGPPFRWDRAARAYTREVTETVDCTNAQGEEIADGYRLRVTTTLTFTPPRGGRPAALHGTYERDAAETDAGRDRGCTAFTASGDVVGGPVGALHGSRWPDLSGTYVATEIVEAVEPADDLRPPGLVGLIGEQRIEGRRGEQITGALGVTADLVATKTGLAGQARTTESCATEPPVQEGFETTETWSELLPLALTADGQAILGGRWRVYQNPTEAGADAGCSLATNTGYVVLVPKDVVG